jgi:hypothetical protein
MDEEGGGLSHTVPVPMATDTTASLQKVALPEPTLVDVILCVSHAGPLLVSCRPPPVLLQPVLAAVVAAQPANRQK